MNVDILNVRQNPGTDQEIIGKVHRDEVYPVLDEQGSWYQIRLSDGSKGWVAAWLVSDASDQAGESFISPEVDHLNVRSGPSTSFRVIKRIHQGETYPVLKREGDWVNIRLSANEDGWVAGWFVQTVSGGSEAESTQQNKATVNVPLLNVRAAPTVESEQLGQLKQGDAVQILEINEGWYRIEYEGQTAWIAGEFTETIASGNQPEADGEGEEPENRRVKVTAEQLNMREGPTLVSPVSGKLKKDDILEVTDSDGDWYEVKTEDGQTGWVANWLVTDVSQNLSNGPHIRILNQGTNLRAGPRLRTRRHFPGRCRGTLSGAGNGGRLVSDSASFGRKCICRRMDRGGGRVYV